MKVTVLLKNEHEALKALFNNIRKPSGARNHSVRQDLFNEIRRELLIHSQMEREIFYPALKAIPSKEVAGLVAKAEQEHDSIEKLLRVLGTMNGADKDFDTRTAQLMDEVVRHMQSEEEEIFEEARKNLAEYRLEELGLEMEDRRKILVTLAA